LWESDLSLSRNLPHGEHRSLEIRADAFNVFNHVNLANPNSTFDVSGVGQITAIRVPMRQKQFGSAFPLLARTQAKSPTP
jgi:hypothetical protein